MKYAGLSDMECAGRHWTKIAVEFPTPLLTLIEADAKRREMSVRQWLTQVANNFFVDQATEARLANARGRYEVQLPVVQESAR